MVSSETSPSANGSFDNPFGIEDLQVFDDPTWHSMLAYQTDTWLCEWLAKSLHGVSERLRQRIIHNLPIDQRACFVAQLQKPYPEEEIEQARQHILDDMFWELIYWKKPELYEELTEGEALHPELFPSIEQDIRGKCVLDAGAGSGRASFECLRYGAQHTYAVEPSPGLLRLLQRKIVDHKAQDRLSAHAGRFDSLPLPDQSVDTAISCSAFTADDEQGGEPGLSELKRVTKPGGKIILIWPRTVDHEWFEQHGFQYVALPTHGEMCIHFRSWQSALNCARLFYARNAAARRYLARKHTPELPFSLTGMNPPCDYFWLKR